jgi:hypothetical protein
MKKLIERIIIVIVLVSLSAAIFDIHYDIFHDKRFIADYFLGSLAFLPISILMVSLIFERIISSREKSVLMNKLNMVIGSFYSEAGNELLEKLKKHINISNDAMPYLMVNTKWSKKDFKTAEKELKGYFYGLDAREIDLDRLKDFLASKKEFLLRLLENQNLLEHETFTDLLWAIFHVTDELESRKDLKKLSQADLAHLSGDIQRFYVLLAAEWIGYMSHLKVQYPYLFSLAVRKNPFDKNARVEIE